MSLLVIDTSGSIVAWRVVMPNFFCHFYTIQRTVRKFIKAIELLCLAIGSYCVIWVSRSALEYSFYTVEPPHLVNAFYEAEPQHWYIKKRLSQRSLSYLLQILLGTPAMRNDHLYHILSNTSHWRLVEPSL
jgi:hypothetical protein